MDEDCLRSKSPATGHSAASTKAHCKQVCVFCCTFSIVVLLIILKFWQYRFFHRIFGRAVCMDAWAFPIHDFMQSR